MSLHRSSPPPEPAPRGAAGDAVAWDTLKYAPKSRRRSAAPYGDGALVVCDNLVRIFKVADLEAVALQGLDLVVEQGEMMAVVGASGSGKSTLLNILGGLDVPTAGRAVVAGMDLGRLTRRARTDFRRRVVGMVWQQTARNLLPYVSAAQNVELPMILDGRADRRRRANELLELVGLGDRGGHRPDRLSGGEQQRVAIAVALANAPELLLADEPTGELDSATATEVFEVLRHVNAELGTTVMVVTHDPLVTARVSRTVAIRDGRTSTETLRRTEWSEEDGHRVISEEFALLDRGGRLQLPKKHIETLGLADRVRLRLEEDHVGVWPDRDAEQLGSGSGPDPRSYQRPRAPGDAAAGDAAAGDTPPRTDSPPRTDPPPRTDAADGGALS